MSKAMRVLHLQRERETMSEATLEQLKNAADNADWGQVAGNYRYGPPCFHFEPERGRFCLRAEGWHDEVATKLFHAFKPLSNLWH